jgi:hypothetical protein
MIQFRVTLALVCVLMASSCKRRDSSNYSKVHSEAGITRPKFSVIHKDLVNLEKKYASRIELITFGQSAGGKPLLAMKIAAPDRIPDKSKKAVIITESIHGNEYLHITDRLVRDFARKSGESTPLGKFIKDGGVVYLIPVYNPDGFIAGVRENANSFDLNRDFARPSLADQDPTQPETKAFLRLINSEQKKENFSLELFMEYHCCIGGLIHPWTYSDKEPSKKEMKFLKEIGQITKKIFDYPYGNAWDIVNYNAPGTSIDFIQESFMRRAFSFEGKYAEEDKNYHRHALLYDEILPLL